MPDAPDPTPVTAAVPPQTLTVTEVATPPDPTCEHPQSAADASTGDTLTPPGGKPQLRVSGVPGPVRTRSGPVRGPIVVAWLVEASRVCGDWLSLSATTAAHSVGLTVADEASFRKWCVHLNIPSKRITRQSDELGSFLQAVTTAHGWTITVHLHNPSAQETRR